MHYASKTFYQCSSKPLDFINLLRMYPMKKIENDLIGFIKPRQ